MVPHDFNKSNAQVRVLRSINDLNHRKFIVGIKLTIFTVKSWKLLLVLRETNVRSKGRFNDFVREERIICWKLATSDFLPRWGGRGTSRNGLYGEAPPERGTFFRLEVYKRVGISRAEV